MPTPVSTVRLIVVDAQHRVLILNRQNTPNGSGASCLPGGKVVYGQTIAEAVMAELRKETGLECTGMRFLFYQGSLPLDPGRMHCINFCFECIGSGTVTLNEEASEYAWISPEDLGGYTLVFRKDEALREYWDNEAKRSHMCGPTSGGPIE